MLPDKDPAESIVLEFNFAGELSAVDSATVAISVNAGRDGGASTMPQGAPQIAGTSVFQRVSLGVAAVDYSVRCVATRGADVRVRKDVLPVR